MKKIFTTYLAIFATMGLFAQTPIPNGGFENWSGILNPAPTSWKTAISVSTFSIQTNVSKETNASNVNSGSSSAKLTTDSVSLIGLGSFPMPGLLALGKISLDITTQKPSFQGIPYSSRPDSFEFYYKYQSAPGGLDTGVVYVNLTKFDPILGTVTVANTFVRLSNTPGTGFSAVKLKVNYQSNLTPDTLSIAFVNATGFANFRKNTFMWVDDVQFRGIDSSFTAYIYHAQNLNFCTGDSTKLSTDQIAGCTYQWYKDNQAIAGATTYMIEAKQTGQYKVEITKSGTVYPSSPVNVNVSPYPIVTYAGGQDSICLGSTPILLTGGSPVGGEYTGAGVVTGGKFNADSAGVAGTKTITYTFTNISGCASSATHSIRTIKCNVGISGCYAGEGISIFPNPTATILNIDEFYGLLIGKKLSIFDIQGKLIESTTINDARTTIQVANYPIGTYFIQVKDENKTYLKSSFQISK